MAQNSTGGVKQMSSAAILREQKIQAHLAQISREEAMLSLLASEKTAQIHEDILGLSLHHKQFGIGRIIRQDSLTVSVQFESGIHRFSYPGAFLDGFLCTEDAAMRQRIDRHQQISREMAECRQRISHANHAIQLLQKNAASR